MVYILSRALTVNARQPRLVLAIRHPSVVAMGTWNFLSSIGSGPATPTGTGMYPITFSQQAPSTCIRNKATKNDMI